MASDKVKSVGDKDFKAQVLDSQEPVLVDFWATWCAPCRAISPVVDAAATEFEGKAKIVKMNIDDNQETPQSYGIRSIPTLLVFKGGKVVEQIVGSQDAKNRITAALKKATA